MYPAERPASAARSTCTTQVCAQIQQQWFVILGADVLFVASSAAHREIRERCPRRQCHRLREDDTDRTMPGLLSSCRDGTRRMHSNAVGYAHVTQAGAFKVVGYWSCLGFLCGRNEVPPCWHVDSNTSSKHTDVLPNAHPTRYPDSTATSLLVLRIPPSTTAPLPISYSLFNERSTN
ncbi:hypothetical protein BD413DRAFT_302762 [Trametes elegans]|nr:hypothetical protein BD413DRAFT_302762 [Trametes elegans]